MVERFFFDGWRILLRTALVGALAYIPAFDRTIESRMIKQERNGAGSAPAARV